MRGKMSWFYSKLAFVGLLVAAVKSLLNNILTKEACIMFLSLRTHYDNSYIR